MNKSRIEQLTRMLPANAGVFTTTDQPGPTLGLAARLAIALNAPDFCHRFITHHVVRGKPLPPSVHESWLRRAHSHYAGENLLPDTVMLAVEGMGTSCHEFTRHVLLGLLVSQNCTHEEIAMHLGLDEPTVRFYEQLHWNVKDRATEAEYIGRLVFPAGRFQMLRPDGFDELPMAQRLLIAGYTHGANEVLFLAGMTTERTQPSVELGLKELESAILANALELTRAGALNAKNVPGINHGRALLTARRNSESAKSPPPSSQTSDISVGDAIRLTMRTTDEEAAAEREGCMARLANYEKILREAKV